MAEKNFLASVDISLNIIASLAERFTKAQRLT